jgi:site-specific recombinase
MDAQHDPRRLAELDALLERVALTPDATGPDLVVRIVAWLRPARRSDGAAAARNIDALAERLEAHAAWRYALRHHLRLQFLRRRRASAYTDPGILSTAGLMHNVWHRLVRQVLPDVVDDESLYDLAALAFHDSRDHEWVDAVPEATWMRLISALDFASGWDATSGTREAYTRLLDAIEVLSHRIAAAGVEPELIRNYPDPTLSALSFVGQADEAHRFVSSYRHALTEGAPPTDDEKHLLVLLGQCKDVVTRVRRTARARGASVGLTWNLVRMTQQIARVEALLAIVSPGRPEGDYRAPWRLCRDIIHAASRRHDVTALLSETTDLVAMRITANAARTGEHYITSTRDEYWAMARAAMGAGAIVPVMALVKLAMYDWHLPPLLQTIAFGLNYAVGFVVLHLLHFTLATKQPAMTASALATSLGEAQDEANLEGLADTIVRVIRSQFVAIAGNVVVAVPVAAVLAALFTLVGPRWQASADTASHLLTDIDPAKSHALVHAGFAGVCLFAAGIVSGFYDNACAYGAVPARLAALGWLRRLIGAPQAERLAAYVDGNAGALAGNLVLGFLLAVVGLIGLLTGLPLDIRHVTFSAANLGIALGWHGLPVPWTYLVWVVTGLIGIGVTNLLVSFGLATVVAMRSHGVPAERAVRLVPLLWGRVKSQPMRFLFPPGVEQA